MVLDLHYTVIRSTRGRGMGLCYWSSLNCASTDWTALGQDRPARSLESATFYTDPILRLTPLATSPGNPLYMDNLCN